MTKPQLPTSFPTTNTHRIVLFQPDIAQSDFDRIEDLLADGLGCVRAALKMMQDIPGDLVLPLQPAEKALRQAFEKRRLLADDMRNAIERWVREAERLTRARGDDPVLGGIQDLLAEAVRLSDRILDLLSAERELEWRRR